MAPSNMQQRQEHHRNSQAMNKELYNLILFYAESSIPCCYCFLMIPCAKFSLTGGFQLTAFSGTVNDSSQCQAGETKLVLWRRDWEFPSLSGQTGRQIRPDIQDRSKRFQNGVAEQTTDRKKKKRRKHVKV